MIENIFTLIFVERQRKFHCEFLESHLRNFWPFHIAIFTATR
jgi:hypothetical protein